MSVEFVKIYGYIYPIADPNFKAYDHVLRQAMSVAKHREKELGFEKGRFELNFSNVFPECETVEQAVELISGLINSISKEKERQKNRNNYRYHNNPSYFLRELINEAGYHEYSPYGENNTREPSVNVEKKLKRLDKINGRLNVLFENEVIYLVSATSNFTKSFILLKEHVSLIGRFEKLDNEYYEQFSKNEMKLLLQGKTEEQAKQQALTIQGDETDQMNIGEVNQQRRDAESGISEYEKEIEKIENFETEELMPLKLEMEKIKLELEKQAKKQMELIEKKKAELELMKTKMEKKIFFLSVDLNALMYYLGEKLTMVQVRVGENAPISQPIIAYQKLRYLDLEMARYTGSNGITWGKADSFEEIIKYRDDLLDVFNQSNKSISFFKLSKSGKITGYSETRNNTLEAYDLDHGSELGFMVRDGGNVYIGWLNDEDITLTEDVFLSYKSTIVEGELEEPDFFAKEKIKNEEKKEQQEMSSRYVIFHLLQGLIDGDNGFFNLTERPNVLLDAFNSSLIIFSLADGWIEDKRFGGYEKVMEDYAPTYENEKLKPIQGEKILTTQRISGRSWGQNDNQSYRSVGYSDRVHDVSVTDKEVYVINKVIDDNVYVSEEKEYSKDRFENPDLYYSSRNKPKMQRIARANILVDSREYVRLTFLNTILVEYLLNLKETSRYGREYSYMAGYYNKMLNYLREREDVELALIRNHHNDIESVSEWQMVLSDWKIKNAVRGEFTDYQAKRFVKYLENRISKK